MKGRATRGASLLSAIVALGCRAPEQKPGFVAMPQMYESLSYKPYDPNPATRSGQTLMVPPPGTVVLGGASFDYGPGPEEARRAGRELRNPLAADEASLRRGRKVFDTVCSVCHGPAGLGDGWREPAEPEPAYALYRPVRSPATTVDGKRGTSRAEARSET